MISSSKEAWLVTDRWGMTIVVDIWSNRLPFVGHIQRDADNHISGNVNWWLLGASFAFFPARKVAPICWPVWAIAVIINFHRFGRNSCIWKQKHQNDRILDTNEMNTTSQRHILVQPSSTYYISLLNDASGIHYILLFQSI